MSRETLEVEVRELLQDFQDAVENEAAAYEWGYPRGTKETDEARAEIVKHLGRLERECAALADAVDMLRVAESELRLAAEATTGYVSENKQKVADRIARLLRSLP